MHPPQKHSITYRHLSFVSFIVLSSLSLTSVADQDLVFHIEVETACMEITMAKQEYDIMPGVAAAYSKGKCSNISSKGKKVFGGCKDLSGGETVWHYDMPEVQGENFKAEVKQDCADWVSVNS